jgi:hypothetical protein
MQKRQTTAPNSCARGGLSAAYAGQRKAEHDTERPVADWQRFTPLLKMASERGPLRLEIAR